MAEHELKTWPAYFDAVERGDKMFEVRLDDRNFAVGDVLRLREWCPTRGDYTGREAKRRVTYVLRDYPAFVPGYVVLGIWWLGTEAPRG
jgi:hypothetical protein